MHIFPRTMQTRLKSTWNLSEIQQIWKNCTWNSRGVLQPISKWNSCGFLNENSAQLVVFLSRFLQENPPENFTPLEVFFAPTLFIISFIILFIISIFAAHKIEIKILQVESNFHAEIRFKSARSRREIHANSKCNFCKFVWISGGCHAN